MDVRLDTQGSELFLGRQPIVDRLRKVVAYELLYRDGDCRCAHVTQDAVATAQVVSCAFARIGVCTVLGPCSGFVNVDAEMLYSRRIEELPAHQVVLELLETVDIDDDVIKRCRQLKRRGYRIALDDFVSWSDRYAPLLEIADIVKIDVPQLDSATLADLVRRLRLYPGKLLAEKVETRERVRECMALGFDLFQGFAFARPALLAL